MLKRLLVLFFTLFSALLIVTNNSYAQDAPYNLVIHPDENSSITSTNPEDINGNTDSVDLTFTELGDGDHYVCLRTDACEQDRIAKTAQKNKIVNNATITLCADGGSQLKINEDGDCDDGDYFHEGKIYRVTIYADNETQIMEEQVSFLVNHYMPDVEVEPENPTNESEAIIVKISKTKKPHNKGNRNNYQVVLEGVTKFGEKYKRKQCGTVKENGTAEFIFDRDENFGPTEGEYLIKVNEHINEDNKLKPDFRYPCSGGFTYYHIPIKIGTKKEPGYKGDNLADPNASDAKAMSALIAEFSKTPIITLKCEIGSDGRGNLFCSSVNTALGNIPTNLQAFVSRLFTIILSIAGIAAFILLVFGGYKYMISRGDPEMIKGARETITSAIIGLLFIVFSLVILQVITSDILKLPSFDGKASDPADPNYNPDNDPDLRPAIPVAPTEYVPDNDTDLRPADPVLIP